MGLLRFILAISVVISHSTPVFGISIVGGQMAVQLFYIISGFYMSLVLNEKYLPGKGSYKLFISNRFLRLFPIYWIVLLFTFLYYIILFTQHKTTPDNAFEYFVNYIHEMNTGTLLFLILTNLVIFGQDLLLFMGFSTAGGGLYFTDNFKLSNPPVHAFTFLPQAWTIGIELMFYLIAPWLVRLKIKYVLVLIAITLTIKIIIANTSLNHDPWTYRFFPAELLFFLMGKLSYELYLKIKPIQFNKFVLALPLVFILTVTTFYFWLPFSCPPLFFTAFFIALPFIFKLSSKWKTDTFIGELSYPIYISHIFVLILIESLNIPFIQNKGTTLVVLTIVFSILLNYFVSDKIERIRQRRVKMSSR
jgi:peptidoglycan/LPS O-acetylase OafA/YrhL